MGVAIGFVGVKKKDGHLKSLTVNKNKWVPPAITYSHNRHAWIYEYDAFFKNCA